MRTRSHLPHDEDTEIFLFTCEAPEGVSISRVLSLSKRARFFAFDLIFRLAGLSTFRRDIGATRGLDRIRSPGAGRTDGRQEEVTDDHHQSS